MDADRAGRGADGIPARSVHAALGASMIVIPYMVFISKIARSWVINITLLAFSASYLLSDWIESRRGSVHKRPTAEPGCT